jgi:hypothetical protein
LFIPLKTIIVCEDQLKKEKKEIKSNIPLYFNNLFSTALKTEQYLFQTALNFFTSPRATLFDRFFSPTLKLIDQLFYQWEKTWLKQTLKAVFPESSFFPNFFPRPPAWHVFSTSGWHVSSLEICLEVLFLSSLQTRQSPYRTKVQRLLSYKRAI